MCALSPIDSHVPILGRPAIHLDDEEEEEEKEEKEEKEEEEFIMGM